MKVCSFVTSGSTAKEVSPTSPRVTLFRASALTGSPSRGATVEIVRQAHTSRALGEIETTHGKSILDQRRSTSPRYLAPSTRDTALSKMETACP